MIQVEPAPSACSRIFTFSRTPFEGDQIGVAGHLRRAVVNDIPRQSCCALFKDDCVDPTFHRGEDISTLTLQINIGVTRASLTARYSFAIYTDQKAMVELYPFPKLVALIVEDNFLLAAVLGDALQSMGCDVLDSVSDLDAALNALELEYFDFAVVDLDLKGICCYPFLDAMDSMHVPYFLASSTPSSALQPPYSLAAHIQKPFCTQVLRQAVIDLQKEQMDRGRAKQ